MSPKTKQDLLTGIGVYAILLAFFIETQKLVSASALFPNMLMVLFFALNTAMVLQALFGKKSKREGATMHAREILMPLLYFAGVVVYVLLFRFLGYFPATLIMLAAYMLVLKVRPIWLVPVVTVGYLLFIYLLFVVWLKTSIL